MPRPPVIYTNEFPYHVTARSNNKDWFDVPMGYCFGIYVNVMAESLDRYNVRLHAFVLMGNHFHAIVSTPDANIGQFLRYFMTETSKGIAFRSGRINHIYGGRNYKSVIYQPEYYAHCFKYVIRNPVKAGLCDRVEDYEYSSFSKQANKIRKLITMPDNDIDCYLPLPDQGLIEWLNQCPSERIQEYCEGALKRSVFEFKATSKYQNKPRLEEGLVAQKWGGASD